MADIIPGSKPDVPIYMKLVRTDDKLDVKKLVVLLAFTVISGYLATQSQRAGSNPDFAKQLKMRFHLGCEKVAVGQTKFWTTVANHHHDLYEIARL